MPLVIARGGSLPSVFAIQMAVSYASFFSSTVTRTNATCEPSGEICGSATQTNEKRSFSLMGRFSAACGNAPAAADTRHAAKTASDADTARFMGMVPC